MASPQPALRSVNPSDPFGAAAKLAKQRTEVVEPELRPTIVIEYGIPVPPPVRRRSKLRDVIDTMEPGASFAEPWERRNKVENVFRKAASANGWKVMRREVIEDGVRMVRFWRLS